MNILDQIKQKRLLQLDKEKIKLSAPSLVQALHKDTIQIIGEIKRASPSKGDIALESFNLLEQATLYHQKGVVAFSILTEEFYFKGENDFLSQVKSAFPSTPLLRKDFIFSPFQVAHAKLLGASALLLIAAMLDDDSLFALHKLSRELDIEVLLEVHNEEELMRALKVPDLRMLGINNRDLKTFKIDLDTSRILIEKIPSEIKRHITLVSESGYRKQSDVRFAQESGFHAVLVGESLMRGEFFDEHP